MRRSVKEEIVLLSQMTSFPVPYHEAISSLSLNGSSEDKPSCNSASETMKWVPRKIIR
ncbi:hypothetical protein J2TS4_06330 [Paenibacillus sp. J2TS4]|nr:hypothetical protein J2TS4_06330 [Paenibacillus sp. J2TS4]